MPERVFRFIENGKFVSAAAFVAEVPSTHAMQPLPGTKPGTADHVRYVSFDRSENPPDHFGAVIDQIAPPLPKRGRAMLEKVILTTPDDTSFYALEYFYGADDPGAWRRQIELGAEQLGLLTARIEGADFVVSDRRRYLLSECGFEYDKSIPSPPLGSARGATIYCGDSFVGREKSGSAYEGLLAGMEEMASPAEQPAIQGLKEALSQADEYVLIKPDEVRLLFPLLSRYAAHLDGQLAIPGDPLDQAARDQRRSPERARKLQFGGGLGWRAYCAEDLLRAFEVADANSEEVALVFV